MNFFSKMVRRIIQRSGYTLLRCDPVSGLPLDFSDEDKAIVRAVQPFTKTSPERILALVEAVRHVVRARVPGALVECGVWRGGSMMAAAQALIALGDTTRHLYLYDTFSGMTSPGEADVSRSGVRAESKFTKRATGADSSDWCLAGIEDVRANMERTGYPMDCLHLVAGKVEDTLPGQAPDIIALLRLDTDWYASTKHELQHLYPRLAEGGVLILDDYGDWLGARQAYDEYAALWETPLFMHRIDDTARLVVKPPRRAG